MALAWPTIDQQIRLEAAAIDGRLADAHLVTTRTGSVAGVLAGRPVDNLPRLLPQLFPLCGAAHAIAGLSAIEAALEIDVAPAQLAARELMLLAEHGAALAWRVLMDWPPLAGRAPDVQACAKIRRAVAAVTGAAGSGILTGIGGARLRPDRAIVGRKVAELCRGLLDLFPEAADPGLSFGRLAAAIEAGASTPARLIAAARRDGLAGYGGHHQKLLPPKTGAWFAARLAADRSFADAPTFDGAPAEVGPLAACRHPVVADAVACWGPTLATRLLAAALDVLVVSERLPRVVDRITDADPAAADGGRSGQGAAVVETARGPLAYLVGVAGGRVTTLRSVAPTEWNFHSAGPFMAALGAAPAVGDPARAARLLAASFDPCVPFTLDLATGRPPAAQETLHA